MKGKHLADLTEGAVTEQDDVEELWQKAKKLYGGAGQDSFAAGNAAGEAADLSDSAATDEELWQGYLELQDGTASRRRALENARIEQQEREEEWLSYYQTSGSPLNRDHEHLRPRLRDRGY
jgi:hypothetical protein